MSARRTTAALAALAVLAVPTACSTPPDPPGPTGPATTSGSPSDAPTPSPEGSSEESPEEQVAEPDPDAPTGWGPTEGELAEARDLVAGWSSAQLAGQVIVGRYNGTDPEVPAALVREHHLAGVCVTAGNVVDEAQVRATTEAVEAAVAADGRDFPAVIGVDEEGGSVAHLRGIATEYPAFAAAGAAVERAGAQGREVVRDAARTTALELRSLGFTWVYAPVADVTIGAADVTIGSRAPSDEPGPAAKAVGAAVRGYNEAGLVSTTKHFPGHGGATADSHQTLPVIDAPLAELTERDLRPFETAVRQGAPSVMLGHLAVESIAPGVSTSLAPEAYDYLRDELGFEGVAITDSLGMGAVLGTRDLAIKALEAGADLLLMPANTVATARKVTAYLEDGRLDRDRVEEAAAKVVALQRWQARVAESAPVPADVLDQAAAASAALSATAYGS